MNIKLYVEGGGDHNKALQTQCRRGFSEFLRRAGLEGRMPRVVACGGRRQAYDSFKTSHAGDAESVAVLLVDSEEPVDAANPWEHVKRRAGDGWERPQNASDDHLHLMVQAMEAWFYADKEAIGTYFGPEFRVGSLSGRTNIDHIPKTDLIAGLREATRRCAKGAYSKGDHSFQILALIDPAKVSLASPAHAGRLLRTLDRLSSA